MNNKIDMLDLKNKLSKSKEYLDRYISEPKLAVVFGTGLSYETLKHLDKTIKISYKDIPFFNKTNIKSHTGELIVSQINNRNLILLSGRSHYYEGCDIQDIVYPIHLLKEIGIKTVLITSSVGGVNKKFKKGDLMIVKDHINFTDVNPLIGYDDSLGERFLHCSNLYNNNLILLTEKIARKNKIYLKKGTMFFMTGPTYETKAELDAIKKIGGDTIGWSTIPEAIIAHYRGLDVLAINCITDLVYKKQSNLEDIIKVANFTSRDLYKVIEGVLNEIG